MRFGSGANFTERQRVCGMYVCQLLSDAGDLVVGVSWGTANGSKERCSCTQPEQKSQQESAGLATGAGDCELQRQAVS